MTKQFSLVLFLSLNIFNTVLFASESPQDIKEDNVTKIERLLKEVEAKIVEDYEEGTIFLGNTSAGKSTLFDYLQGVPLVAESVGFGKYKIDFAPNFDHSPYSSIGHKSTISETTFPVIFKSNFDSPGFQDTRPLQDIVNAYSIYKLINHTKKLKILLTTSLEEIQGVKGKNFISLIKQIGEIFSNNIAGWHRQVNFETKEESGIRWKNSRRLE